MIKLSELNTDESLDLLCDLTPYVSEIAEDKEVIKLFSEKVKLKANASEEEFKRVTIKATIDKVGKLVPVFLKKHREAIYNILSILNTKDVEEIKKQKITITINEIKTVLLDQDFLDFFSELLK